MVCKCNLGRIFAIRAIDIEKFRLKQYILIKLAIALLVMEECGCCDVPKNQ